MNPDILNRITGPQGLLDYNDRERLTYLQNHVDHETCGTRGERLRAAQRSILDIVQPRLEGLAGDCLEIVEGGIALAKVTGDPVTAADTAYAKAAKQILAAVIGMREGRLILEPKNVADGSFLLDPEEAIV